MPLPAAVARRLRDGDELGHAIDALTGESGTKHRGGAVAVLTAGLVDRRQAYEVILAYASQEEIRVLRWGITFKSEQQLRDHLIGTREVEQVHVGEIDHRQ